MDTARENVKMYFKDREYNRNRKNVFNIVSLMEKFRKEIEELVLKLENNDDDS
jgi:hypothetical protein